MSGGASGGKDASLTAAPTGATDRIESLDVLRGVALLGILLLNIVGFGLHSAAYFNPLIGLGDHPGLNLAIWGGVSVFFEGAMRALFSMLFGAGVVMFTTGLGSRSGAGKSGWLHYRRTFWLLAFGVFDAYLLLWTGDILIVYALCGALLYPLRNARPRTLLILAAIVIVLTSLSYEGLGQILRAGQQVAAEIQLSPEAAEDEEAQALAQTWAEFSRDFLVDDAAQAEELEQRRAAYPTVARFSAALMNENLLFVVPVFLLWDALAMMLLGMALYRMGLLSGERSNGFFLRLTIGGFAVGLLANGWELYRAVATDYDLLAVFSYVQGTYHIGRLGMALGWMGAVMLICRQGRLHALRARLAAVGRMALTNYLMHSLICLFVFTGAGFALVGQLERWALYLIVFAIWGLQLWLSPWWLGHFAFGPAEWLWRTLTYGSRQRFLASP
jgi:uncharacterized protein